MVLSANETSRLWDRVSSEFHFYASIDPTIPAFQFNVPFDTYDISGVTDEQLAEMQNAIPAMFAQAAHGGTMYALDWQHECFLFDPSDPSTMKNELVPDPEFPDETYNAPFPMLYPDGDYSFFIAEDFSFGYLGHPWQERVWIFGEELIALFRKSADKIGFVLENV